MAKLTGLASEWLRFLQRNPGARIDELKMLPVGLLAIKLIRLVAHGIAESAFQSMAVIVQHFLEWPFVNHCLVALEAFALLALERFNRQRTKFDPVDGLPRLRVALQDARAIKAGVQKSADEILFRQCARDA